MEKEFIDADTLDWPDEAKQQILFNALNKLMTNVLINCGISAIFSDLISCLYKISSDINILDITMEQVHRLYTSRQNNYEMDWISIV